MCLAGKQVLGAGDTPPALPVLRQAPDANQATARLRKPRWRLPVHVFEARVVVNAVRPTPQSC
jgi:hypothetical protein